MSLFRYLRHAPACLVLILAALGAWPATCPAATTASPAEPLIVAVREAPPFAMEDAESTWRGLTIALWERIAELEGLEYEYRELDLGEMLAALEDGEVDVAAAALTMTPDRERIFDFSHTFLSSGLGIATRARKQSPLDLVREAIFDEAFGLWILGFLVLATVPGALIYIFERKKNPEQFSGTPAEGVGKGIWWAIVTMTTVGFGDKAPRSIGGRILAVIWMYAGILLISGFTAVVASTVTVERVTRTVNGPEDLQVVRVGALADSTGAEYLTGRNISYEPYSDVETMIGDLARGRLDAVVHDAPILLYLIHRDELEQVVLLPEILVRQDYAFGLSKGQRELMEKINRSLLEVLRDLDWPAIRRSYLGS